MTDVDIDVKGLEAEVAQLSKEDLQAEFLKLRVRQKKQQLKNQGSETQKKYQKRQQMKNKLLKEAAQRLGIYDSLNAQAQKQAEEEVANETEVGDEEEKAS